MIYRVHIAVLLAIPEEWTSCIPENEKTSSDMVAYTFGINAPDTVKATDLAVQAAKNAVGREGEFIGGVVIEVHCRHIDRKEFNGYEKYFLHPLTRPGIFYVSGTTYSWTPNERVTEALSELEKVRANIKLHGLPTPSFVHPKLPNEPLKNIRLLCSVCGHWIEAEGLDVIFSFMGGLDMFSEEQRAAWKGHSIAGPFVKRHLADCFMGFHASPRAIVAIHEDDDRWSSLSETDREGEDTDQIE